MRQLYEKKQESKSKSFFSFKEESSQNSIIHNQLLQQNNLQNRIVKKILILGYNQVGKTSLANKFLFDFFVQKPQDLYQDEFYCKLMKINNQKVELQIVDVPSIDSYSFMTYSKFSQGIDGYIILYSVNSRISFEQANQIRMKLFNLNGKHLPQILVGNKCEIVSQRQVQIDEGQALARLWDVPFIEISAKNDNLNQIQKPFKLIYEQIDKAENPLKYSGFFIKKIKFYLSKNGQFILKLFKIISALSGLLGIFILLFGAIFTVMSPTYVVKNGVILFLLILIGLMQMLISIFGLFGVNSKNIEYLKIFIVLTLVQISIEIISFILISKFDFNEIESNEEYQLGQFIPLIYSLLISQFSIQLFSILFSILSISYIYKLKDDIYIENLLK